MDYEKSVELAIAKGYEAILDPDAYKGVCYTKDGLIWIHKLDALMRSLEIDSEEQLRQRNYDVDAYHKYKNYSNEDADSEMRSLYADLSPGEGQPAYLMDGMYLYPDGTIREI